MRSFVMTGEFRRFRQILRRDLDIDGEVIADRHEPGFLIVGIGSARLLLTAEPEIEPAFPLCGSVVCSGLHTIVILQRFAFVQPFTALR
jgi:hypothetical protein